MLLSLFCRRCWGAGPQTPPWSNLPPLLRGTPCSSEDYVPHPRPKRFCFSSAAIFRAVAVRPFAAGFHQKRSPSGSCLFFVQQLCHAVWKCHHRDGLKVEKRRCAADPCENACPPAYAYISPANTFNYNTVPVPLTLTGALKRQSPFCLLCK